MVNYNLGDCFVAAFLHTKKLLFKKFDLKTYLFCMFLMIVSSSFSFYGLNCRYYNMGISDNNIFGICYKHFNKFLYSIFDIIFNSIRNIFTNHAVVNDFKVFIVSIILMFLFIYIAIILKLIFFDFNIFKNKFNFKEYWNRNKEKSDNIIKYFLKQFFFAVLWTAGIVLVIGFLFITINNNAYIESIKNSNIGQMIEFFKILLGLLSLVIVLYLFIRITIVLSIAWIFILPLYPQYKKDIKLDEIIKNFYSELKGKFWKSLLFYIFIFILNIFLTYFFVPVQMLISSIFLYLFKSQGMAVYFIALGVVVITYILVIVIVNVPIAVYLNSFYQLISSLLCPNYAILLPVKNEQGKVIDTMTYFEHLEMKKEQIANNEQVENNEQIENGKEN